MNIKVDTPRYYKTHGFTIVELLIVIVVIGILAAITMVAYNGMQNRAHAAKVGVAFSNYVKILELYKIEHGRYPEPETQEWYCLGTPDQYPAEDPYAEGECDTYGSPTSPALIAALSTVASPLPSAEFPSVFDGDLYSRGLSYAHWGDRASIASYTKGDNDCPQGDPEERVYLEENDVTFCVNYLRE